MVHAEIVRNLVETVVVVRVERGRVGPKYQAWTGAPVKGGNPELRNYADNSKTLHIP